MMDKLQLIQNRRDEVERDIADLESRLAEMRKELDELTTFERVNARFDLTSDGTRASRAPTGAADGHKSAPAVSRTLEEAAQPTMPEMIVRVLSAALKDGHKSLENREIADAIRATFKVDLNDDYVSSTIWRLWKRGRVRKIRQGVYALPKETPTSEGSGENALVGVNGNPAQGGEARLGGGT